MNESAELATEALPLSIDAIRAAIDAQQRTYPIPDGVGFASLSLGDVPVLSALPTAAYPDAKRIFYLHGGGYVAGTLEGYRSFTGHLAMRTGARVDNIGYRLSPEHRFPAALDDALAAYRAMLEGTQADHIVFAGDSAGGGLTLALLIAARDAGLPLPCGALLISPWLALDAADVGSRRQNSSRDAMMSSGLFSFMREAYVGATGEAPLLASPLPAVLRGLPPLMIVVGSAEMLLDDAVGLARRAADADVRVSLDVRPQMVHGWHARSATLIEADDTIDAAARFLSRRLRDGISWECRDGAKR
jgi:epsilon-lactone hydrolase